MSERSLTGQCQCGFIRYAVQGEPLFAAICHCTMCRRASAAPAVAWAMFPESAFTSLANDPAQYSSSAAARRYFCPRCGTQIAFRADFIPGLVDITLGSLDDPDAIKPSLHYWYSKHLSWFKCEDELPKHAELPPVGEE